MTCLTLVTQSLHIGSPREESAGRLNGLTSVTRRSGLCSCRWTLKTVTWTPGRCMCAPGAFAASLGGAFLPVLVLCDLLLDRVAADASGTWLCKVSICENKVGS